MGDELIKRIFEEKIHIIQKYLIKLGCNPHDAEDIVQDSFYKALKYFDGIESSKISSWLFKVSINKYYDLCRKNNNNITFSIHEDIIKDSLMDNFLIEDYLLDLEKKEEIVQVLNCLTDIYKNLLILKYDVNLSYKEIAELLDINEKTVKTYLFRAREQFKKLWRDKYEK